ncbi:MAG TPA: hypothetical protein VFX92_10990 [Candidatus Krumholzibacteria bacterium]|nr:hypothetical protein [Candidatus Krumholzibacteria bacterium]
MNVHSVTASDRDAGAWFRPSGAVTGVGSLPHTDPARAIAFVARWAPEVPFWPQLRRRSAGEAMLPQTFGAALAHLVPVRGEHAYSLRAGRADRFAAALESDGGRLDPGNAAGFQPFVDALAAGAFPGVRAAKGQAMGPVTLACSVLVDGVPLIEHAALRELLADHVVRVARWQAGMLRPHAPAVIMVLDEAYLGGALRAHPGSAGVIADLLRSVVLRVRGPRVLVGIHCCDEIPFAVLDAVSPDLYSFDAWNGAGAMAGDPAARRFLAAGGLVAWGWIPTRDDLTGVDVAGLAARWDAAAARLAAQEDSLNAARILASALVTASCGLAGSSEATCERSFELAAGVGRRFAEQAGSA